jgi:AraC-like DNA-binding protein
MMAVRVLVAAVEAAGVDRQRFLAEARLAATRLDADDARLPLADYSRVVRAALSTTGDPALGLHMGQRENTGSFDVVGPLSDHSPSLREALQMSARYARIVMEGPQLDLCEEGDTATLRFTLLCGESPEVRLTAEFSTSSILYLVRRFAGSAAQARRVFFAYKAPAYRAEYARVFGGREHFSHEFTGVEFERSWLDLPRFGRSPELYVLLQARAELLLARLGQDVPAAERVRRWLASQGQQARPTMDTTARGLGMSARSLRRRLREERAPYRELVDEARARLAKGMLADPHASVQDAAYAMGFGTPAAFTRAFKRWTGMAPSAYRAARPGGQAAPG